MPYLSSIGTFQGAPPSIPGFPGSLPGFVPGPGSPGVPPMPGPTMAAGIFPTSLRVGDVAQVTGPFANKMQGQVVVRFNGTRGIAVNLTGPFGGSVVVPEGAQTGACTIEVDGRQVFGRNCVITRRSGPSLPRRGGWYNFGPTTEPLGASVGSASAGVIVGVVLLFGVLISALGHEGDDR